VEIRRPTRAVLAAAIAGALLELLAAYARGWDHRPGYYLACALGSVVLAAVLGLLAGALRLAAVPALALWAGACGMLLHGIGTALALALGVLAVGRAGAATRPADTRLGLAAGASLGVAVLVAQRGAPALPVRWLEPLLLPAAFLALLACATLAARVAPRVRARTLLVALAAPVLVAGLARERAARAPSPEPRRHEGAGPHVFLLVLDTVRADHLSLYGYERETMPLLARRVASRVNAAVYPWAFANETWTAPSHATLLTGRLPAEHEVHLGTPDARTMDWTAPTRFRLRADETLAERFHAAGFATLAVFANPWLTRIEGLERGFDVYREVSQSPALPGVGEWLRRWLAPAWCLEDVGFAPAAPRVAAELLRAVDAEPGRRLFVLANFLDAHAPYRPPPGDRGRFAPWRPWERPQDLAGPLAPAQRERLMARYDESLLALDRALDALLAALDARGILDEAWVFITSDHGEAFGEHGVTDHGTGVYNEIVHVPLVVLPPRGVTLVASDAPVSLVDVAATAAAIAGRPLSDRGELRSGAPGVVVAQFYSDPRKARLHGALAEEPAQVLVSDHRKLIRYRDRLELYDLEGDPAERRDLSGAEAERVRGMTAALPEIDFGLAGTAESGAEDAALRERLEALGYVESE
jgi:arylsulfatase A-like enzyme